MYIVISINIILYYDIQTGNIFYFLGCSESLSSFRKACASCGFITIKLINIYIIYN